MWKEEFIRQIECKLTSGEKLTDDEIGMVIVALRKADNLKQEPYAVCVYHDEWGREKHIRMEPSDTRAEHLKAGTIITHTYTCRRVETVYDDDPQIILERRSK